MPCIYCRRETPEATFKKAEHVLPQAFGTFRDNFTLFCVCDECNNFFGDNLELYLGRDTIEGLDRFLHGTSRPQEFKTLGRRGSRQVRFQENLYKGALARPEPKPGKFLLYPEPQIGFAVGEGEFTWYLLPDVPARDAFPQPDQNLRIRLLMVSPDEAAPLLRGKGFGEIAFANTINLDEGAELDAEVTTKIGPPVLRAVAKVAFNYLAYTAGAEVALRHEFDAVRSYIRLGDRPSLSVVHVDDEAILAEEVGSSTRKLGHIVTVDAHVDRPVLARVSFFNQLRYVITLAEPPHGLELRSGHFFDPANRVIDRLEPGLGVPPEML